MNNNSKTAAYCSLGCKVNQYDTDAMRLLMEGAGFVTVPFSDTADIYVINTCSVTHVSDRKSRQMISRAHSLNPNAIIIVAGCYAKTNPNGVAELEGVNIVLGTNDRNEIADVVLSYINANRHDKELHTASEEGFEDLTADESDKTRAYLKIQDGCNRFCSYCIIPYARGRIRSRTLESTRKNLILLAQRGYKEVVLTGIHLMSYGIDMNNGTDITDAIAQADGIDAIKRIRLGSLEPEFVTDKFVRAVSENERVCRQFHLSLQSGSDSVLQRMNRKYTTEQYAAAVNKLRAAMPDCAITTDIIAGFAGETEAEHKETLEFIKRIGFARVHVFPYSVRQGTAAAGFPNQVPPEIKERRAHETARQADASQHEYMSNYIGKDVEVLIEEKCLDGMRGYTSTYTDVHITDADETLSNELRTVHINGIDDKHLVGELLK